MSAVGANRTPIPLGVHRCFGPKADDLAFRIPFSRAVIAEFDGLSVGCERHFFGGPISCKYGHSIAFQEGRCALARCS
jgi:hypothetical protein